MLKALGFYARQHHLALIALFVALGGVSYAAVNLPNNSVGAGEIKKNAVRSSEVRNNALKGVDINEASMAKVPAAATADSAGSADGAGLLDGIDSSAFQRSARWAQVRGDGTIASQSGGIQVVYHDGPTNGSYILDFNSPVTGKAILAAVTYQNAADLAQVHVSPCGPGGDDAGCDSVVPGADSSGEHVLAFTASTAGTGGDEQPFYVVVLP